MKWEHLGIAVAGLGAVGLAGGYVVQMLRAYNHYFIIAIVGGLAVYVLARFVL